MSSVVFDQGDVEVDASLIAEGLLLAPSLVLPLLRDGLIASGFERGMGEDSGRYRLTFVHDRRRLQLVVDEAGEVLDRSETVSLNADAPLTCQFFLEDHAVRHSYHHLARIRAALARAA